MHEEGVGTEDLFKSPDDSGSKAEHIVVEGEPGIGKTTLCHKLAYDWARGISHSNQMAAAGCGHVTADIHRFKLVFFMEARRLEEASLLDCIYASLLPEDFIASKKMLGSLLEKPDVQELVLFIIDAYDELSNKNEQLQKLIERRIYSRCSVVVTTRPTYANSIISNFDSGFVILGYPFHKRKEFIRKYVEETKGDIKIFRTLERNLLENDTVADLSRNPLYLWFLCMLVEDNEGRLPETRTQLFEEVMDLLLKKARVKLKLTEDDCQAYFHCLSRLAFESQKQRRVHFSEALLRIYFPYEDASVLGKLGFLAREMSSSRLRPSLLFTFTHKTIQEFLAANYLVSIDPEKRISFVQKRRKDRLWWMVWIFLSGLLQGDDAALDTHYRNAICKDLTSSVTSATSLQADDQSHNTYHLGLQCLGESGLFATFDSLSPLIVPAAFVYHVMACHYCLQGFVMAHSEKVPAHFPDLVVNGLDLEMHQMFDYKLLDAVGSCRNLQSLVFAEVMSVNILLQYLTKFCACNLHLKHLYIYMSPAVHPDLHEVGYSLQELRNAYKSVASLESLVFRGSETSMYKGAESIASGLEMLLVLLLSNTGPKLKSLVLNEQNLTHMATAALTSRLHACTNLTKLFLEAVRFPSGQFELLTSKLTETGKLNTLHLVCCLKETEEGDVIALPDNLPELLQSSQIHELTLENTNLKANMLEEIMTQLQGKDLKHFEVVGERLNRESLHKITSTIGTFQSLVKLTLCDIGISSGYLQVFAQSLKNLTSLEKLDLSSNELGSSDSFAELTSSILQLERLRYLKLDNCGITDNNVRHFHEIFHRIPLTIVSLIGNPIGESSGGVRDLLRVLEASKSLDTLSLTCVRFTPQTGLDLAKALSGNTSLRQLNVLCHPTPELMSCESFKALYKDICEAIPSLQTFSRGFNTNVKHAHLWRKNDHAYYRSICLGKKHVMAYV